MTDETKNTYPLGIRPNPDYYVPSGDEIEKIGDFIEKTDGAVIGLTGVRGSGKSTLMDGIVSKYEIKDESTTKKKYFTLKITSPTGYDEKEFFIMVFKRLCEGVIKKIEERMGIHKSLKKIIKEDRLNKITLIIATVTSLSIALMLTAPFYFDPYYLEGSQVGALLYPLFGEFTTIISRIIRFIIIAIICFFLIITLALVVRSYIFPLRYSSKYGALRRITQNLLETIEYEKTMSYKKEVKIGFFEKITGIFNIGKELKTRPFTLPGLTSEYIDYIPYVTEVFGGKAIICIDELDKITDPEEVKKLLRGIKGTLSVKNCYYLISISEDAVESFEARLSEDRDIIESTFDEMITLDRVSLPLAKNIVINRLYGRKGREDNVVPENIRESAAMIGVLSGGVPRELIRNLRDVRFGVDNVEDITPQKTWEILFKNKVKRIKGELNRSYILGEVKIQIYDNIKQIENSIREKIHYIHTLKLIDDFFNELERHREYIQQKYSKEVLSSSSATKEEVLKIIGKMTKDIDKIIKRTIELNIYIILFVYQDKNYCKSLKENGESYHKILEKLSSAYSILSYNKELSKRHIDESVEILKKCSFMDGAND